jgi:hypothetical protein
MSIRATIKEKKYTFNTMEELYNFEKFDEINKLDCSEDDDLEEIKKLPKNLEELNCCECPITKLPNLPKKLKSLDCSNCSITHPLILPEGIEEIVIGDIDKFPKLPISIQLINTYTPEELITHGYCETENGMKFSILKLLYQQEKNKLQKKTKKIKKNSNENISNED